MRKRLMIGSGLLLLAILVTLVVWQGSGDMAANARANCYAVLPGDVEQFHAGDSISVVLR